MEPNMTYISLRHFERLQSNPSESRLQEILNTNTSIYCLPDSEQFQHALRNCDRTVADLEEDFRSAQQALHKIGETIPLAKSYAAKIHILFHPMRSLPDDILIEIFKNCVPHSLKMVQQDSLSPKFPPWVLSHVCSRWRDISTCLPRLWCVVDLPLDKYYSNVPLGRVVYKLEELISRSAPCDISLRAIARDAPTCPDVLFPLNRALKRTRVMGLQLPLQTIKDDFSANYSKLSSLSLTFDASHDMPLETFSSAFALTSFTQLRGPPIKIPVACLRLYNTASSSWPGWDLLRRMALVEGLHIQLPNEVLQNAENDSLLSKPLIFEWMSSLSLEESHPLTPLFSRESRVEYVTRRMKLPRLDKLTLRYQWRGNVEFPKLYFPDALTRLYISVCNSDCRIQDLLGFLKSTKNVENLTLSSLDPPNVAPEILMALTIRRLPHPLLLPRLKRLSLGPSILSSSQCQRTIVQMIASRGVRNHTPGGDSDVARCMVMLDTRETLKEFEKAWETFMENESWKGETTRCGLGFRDLFSVQAKG